MDEVPLSIKSRKGRELDDPELAYIALSVLPALMLIGIVVNVYGTGKKAFGILLLCLAAFWFALPIIISSMDSGYVGSRGLPFDLVDLLESGANAFGSMCLLLCVWGAVTIVMLLGLAGMAVYNVVDRFRKPPPAE